MYVHIVLLFNCKIYCPWAEVEPFLFGKKEEGQIWPNSENVSFLRFIAVCRP